MKMRWLSLLVVGLFLVGASPAPSWAVSCEFYYQRIEQVVQVNNPSPQGWWEKTKTFGKKLVNNAHMLWSNVIEQYVFPGEGTKMRFSKEDENIAYKMKRVKVKSEQHLLELMGCKNASDTSRLTDGQKALVAMYRQSLSPAMTERDPYAIKDGIKIFLTDTTGFEDEKKYPHVSADFWPTATGKTILMNSKRYSYPGSETDAQATFMHEYAHCMDRTWKEFIKAYGQDGTHFANEMTRPRTAWLEGFAIYNEMIEFPGEATYVQSAIQRIRVESKTDPGSYTIKPREDPGFTGMQLLNVEGINANILFRLAKELPDGKNLVFQSVAKTNYPWRSLRHVISHLTKTHPEHLGKIATIMDDETLGRLSDTELLQFIGTSAAARQFAAQRKNPEVVAAPVLPPPPKTSEENEVPPSSEKIVIDPEQAGRNPFADK